MYEISRDSLERTKRYAKWRARTFVRYAQMAGLMFAAAVVVPITLFSLGLLFGRGLQGFVAAPLAVFVAWGLILFWGFRRRATPKTIAKAALGELPAKTAYWLQGQRLQLPAESMPALDGILMHLEHLGPQLEALGETSPAARQLRRLLVDELTGLVDHYCRLPPHLKKRPLHGGPSPEHQVSSGLATIRVQLGRVHDQLARGDLHSLATSQRFLELKYQDDSKES